MKVRKISEYRDFEEWWSTNKDAIREDLIVQNGDETIAYVDEVLEAVQFSTYTSRTGLNEAKHSQLEAKRQQGIQEILGCFFNRENIGANMGLLSIILPSKTNLAFGDTCNGEEEREDSILAFNEDLTDKSIEEVVRINNVQEAIIRALGITDSVGSPRYKAAVKKCIMAAKKARDTQRELQDVIFQFDELGLKLDNKIDAALDTQVENILLVSHITKSSKALETYLKKEHSPNGINGESRIIVGNISAFTNASQALLISRTKNMAAQGISSARVAYMSQHNRAPKTEEATSQTQALENAIASTAQSGSLLLADCFWLSGPKPSEKMDIAEHVLGETETYLVIDNTPIIVVNPHVSKLEARPEERIHDLLSGLVLGRQHGAIGELAPTAKSTNQTIHMVKVAAV